MEKDWQVCCKALQKFTNLKTLEICLRIQGYGRHGSLSRWVGFADSGWLKGILEPLEPLSASEDFVVKYSWPMADCQEWPEGKFRMEHEPGYC